MLSHIKYTICGLPQDWGDVPPEDAIENDLAVRNDLRILSSSKVGSETVWIITEADHSVKTFVFPYE
jgi:hypothetical protein